jgi:hypothetical protein
MPAEYGELAGDGDGGDLMAALGADTYEEGAQRPRRLGRRPRRLDQHGARVTAADFADAPVTGRARSRLPYPRVQPEITHQLLRTLEPADVADRRNDPGCDREVYARDRHQSSDRGIVDRDLCNLAVEEGQVFREPVKLPHVPIDGGSLVIRQG